MCDHFGRLIATRKSPSDSNEEKLILGEAFFFICEKAKKDIIMSLSVLLIVNYVNFFMIILQPQTRIPELGAFLFPFAGVCFSFSAQAWPA